MPIWTGVSLEALAKSHLNNRIPQAVSASLPGEEISTLYLRLTCSSIGSSVSDMERVTDQGPQWTPKFQEVPGNTCKNGVIISVPKLSGNKIEKSSPES
jgi:hypothetical protein